MSKVRMFRRLVSAVVLGLIGLLGLFSGVADRFAQATDWPQFRGPRGSAVSRGWI